MEIWKCISMYTDTLYSSGMEDPILEEFFRKHLFSVMKKKSVLKISWKKILRSWKTGSTKRWWPEKKIKKMRNGRIIKKAPELQLHLWKKKIAKGSRNSRVWLLCNAKGDSLFCDPLFSNHQNTSVSTLNAFESM